MVPNVAKPSTGFHSWGEGVEITYSCTPTCIISSILHDLLWYSGRTELAPSGFATPILTGALEASAASDRQCTANHENWPRIRLGRDSNNTLTIIYMYMYYVQCKL